MAGRLEACRLFSRLLAYPGGDPTAAGQAAETARECARLVGTTVPAAAAELETFARICEGLAAGVLEEVYTATFDLNPACCPYLGYQLLGESYKRAELLVGLKERYREQGFDCGGELADHIVVVLAFVASLRDGDRLAAELIAEALVPAVRKMAAALGGGGRSSGNPYRSVLAALLAYLEAEEATACCAEGA